MDSKDIERWYRRYAPMVHRRCRQLLRDEALAEEATQEVFVKVLRDADRLTDDAPASYLWQAATTVALNLLRSRRRRPEDADADLPARIADLTASAESGAATRQLLDRLFRRQKPGTDVIAVLHFVDGMTLDEVARTVGMSVSGVRRRLAEVQARLARLGETP